jgi:hypothetical protein
MESTVLAHWHTRVEDFQLSTQEFYQRLQQALEQRKYPQMNLYRLQLPEGGVVSPNRDYLRIHRGDLDFDICAAPFGTDYFISWWLLEKPGCGCLPFLGILGASLARKTTYYQADTAIIFRESVHARVLEVLKDILGDKAQIEKLPLPTVAKSSLL